MAQFTWSVPLVGIDAKDNTEVARGDEIVTANWDPAHALTSEGVMDAARTQAWWRSKAKVKFMPVGDPKLVTA